MSAEHPQSQSHTGSKVALYEAVDAARQATQAAEAVGVEHVHYSEGVDPFLIATDNKVEAMQAGEIYGWDSPAVQVRHSVGGVTTTIAKTSFLDRRRREKLDYEVYDHDDPNLEKLLADRPLDPEMREQLGHTRPVPAQPLGTIRRIASNGEVLSERKVYRPETARRLATTIANQVTRRAETAHSAQLAPRRAPRRSQFSQGRLARRLAHDQDS